jgi:hypothetical protein
MQTRARVATRREERVYLLKVAVGLPWRRAPPGSGAWEERGAWRARGQSPPAVAPLLHRPPHSCSGEGAATGEFDLPTGPTRSCSGEGGEGGGARRRGREGRRSAPAAEARREEGNPGDRQHEEARSRWPAARGHFFAYGVGSDRGRGWGRKVGPRRWRWSAAASSSQ